MKVIRFSNKEYRRGKPSVKLGLLQRCKMKLEPAENGFLCNKKLEFCAKRIFTEPFIVNIMELNK